jgi:ATP-binding cassette subfamily A (ABC1) protein 3
LTVSEHVRIFSDLKCTSAVNAEIVTELVRSCDLKNKLLSHAKTLSGGQKRKLQLAMMFAGGSAVCCVDEVSTGLDPISRRRIWEILLAERSRRTIILTTHFLDEADYLADNIVIMYKGSLRAEGTAATLKNRFGNGYTIKMDAHTPLHMPLSGPVELEESRNQIVYRVATSALAAEAVEYLESRGISDYNISGPTMEELFMKATGDTIASPADGNADADGDSDPLVNLVGTDTGYNLFDGRPISVFKQWYILFGKRFRILRRRYIPYVVAISFAVAGAAVAPLLIKSFRQPIQCPAITPPFPSGIETRYDLSDEKKDSILIGPADKINDDWLRRITSIYSSDHTQHPDDRGYNNINEFRQRLVVLDSYDDIVTKISNAQKDTVPYSESAANLTGGLWLGDDNAPVVFSSARAVIATRMLNLLNNILSGVGISASYDEFDEQVLPTTFDVKAVLFVIYYGLIMAAYPAFFVVSAHRMPSRCQD